MKHLHDAEMDYEEKASSSLQPMTAEQTDLNQIVGAFLAVFNEMDLEKVLLYFADDATYEPGDGTKYTGIAQIREAFRPQFSHAWGTFHFIETDRIVNLTARKIVLVWDCHIDPSTAQFYTWRTWLRITFGKLIYGKAAKWKGLDVLTFNAQGLIIKKSTYANYRQLLIQSYNG